MKTIDINCDLGEGGHYDADLMPLISSCSIACGGHYGDDDSMKTAIRSAKANGVKIGAHPSYPDKGNFGRQPMQLSDDDLISEFKKQVLRIKNIAEEENYPITHIKPHGALYNEANTNPEIAKMICNTVLEMGLDIPLFVAYNSEIGKTINTKKGKIDMLIEGFGDRNYNEDYSLVSRKKPNALIKTKEEVSNHIINMISENRVEVITGKKLPIYLDTVCMHGDSENVLENLRFLRQKLSENNIKVAAYG